MCVCLCVCMQVYMSMFAYAHAHARKHTDISEQMHTCRCTHTCLLVYVCVCMCMFACVSVFVRVCEPSCFSRNQCEAPWMDADLCFLWLGEAVNLSDGPSDHLSVRKIVFPPVCLPVSLSVHLSVSYMCVVQDPGSYYRYSKS